MTIIVGSTTKICMPEQGFQDDLTGYDDKVGTRVIFIIQLHNNNTITVNKT